jgi:hypothetical protein
LLRLPNTLKWLTGAALMSVPVAAHAQVQAYATQVVRLEIRPINQVALSGTTTFTLPARSGSQAEIVTSASASYAITTNEENRRILVALDEHMPSGVTLTMRMAAPSGARAGESVTLSADPQVAVTGISRLNARDLGIDFTLRTAASAVIPSTVTRTVRVTLVSGV